jgi:hypothetical protein
MSSFRSAFPDIYLIKRGNVINVHSHLFSSTSSLLYSTGQVVIIDARALLYSTGQVVIIDARALFSPLLHLVVTK